MAEEKAGKVGVKLVFPIFFFCMPSLVIVVAGPAMLQLCNHFSFITPFWPGSESLAEKIARTPSTK